MQHLRISPARKEREWCGMGARPSQDVGTWLRVSCPAYSDGLHARTQAPPQVSTIPTRAPTYACEGEALVSST